MGRKRPGLDFSEYRDIEFLIIFSAFGVRFIPHRD